MQSSNGSVKLEPNSSSWFRKFLPKVPLEKTFFSVHEIVSCPTKFFLNIHKPKIKHF